MELQFTTKNALRLFRKFNKALSKEKIFCISFQKNGTTSVGKFFKEHNYDVASYQIKEKNEWTKKWFENDYESIFKSWDFKKSTVFEDDPWWCMDFYKVLFHKFPKSKFILMTRDPDKWFDSMASHFSGRAFSIENIKIHARIYNRHFDFLNDSSECNNISIELTDKHREHYKSIYNLRNQEVLDFFKKNDDTRLVHTTLESSEKWNNIGQFSKIKLLKQTDFYENRTAKNDPCN